MPNSNKGYHTSSLSPINSVNGGIKLYCLHYVA